MQHLVAFCNRPEGASDVISGRIAWPREVCKIWSSSPEPFSRNSARSRQKQYFGQCFRYYFRPEVCNDVISGAAIDYVGMDVLVNVGDSW